MELWLHHLCLFAGCNPAVELADEERAETAQPITAEREAVLEDA